MTTRRECLSALAASAAISVPRLAGAANNTTSRTLTAADVHVAGYPTVAAVQWLGEQLERVTEGRVAIRVYHSGQLGREGDTIDLTRFGAIDITRVNFAAINNPFPLTRVAALPYVFDSTAHMRRAMDGAPGREILADFERRGLIGLAIYDSGVRCVYNVRRPIHTPGDLVGLKLRVPPSDIFIHLLRGLGANPTPLAFGEVYSALQTHLIDGAENNIKSFDSSRQFEVARYWSETRHSYSPEALVISKRTYDRLIRSDQERLRELAAASVPRMREAWDAAETASRAKVTADGVAVNDVNLEAFRRASEPLLKRELTSPALQALYERIRAVA
jgi:tripartite ATP-independent transporter DctP family solute receptor